jgi:hypothetical protein
MGATRGPRPGEETLFARGHALGSQVGESYPKIWDDTKSLVTTMRQAIGSRVPEIVGTSSRRMVVNHVVNVVLFVAGFVFFGVFIGFSQHTDRYSLSGNYDPSAQGVANAMIGFWLLTTLAWVVALIASYVRWSGLQRSLAEQRGWLLEVASSEAAKVIDRRRAEARSHEPGEINGDVVRPPAPAPQPYGVSHEGAEHLVAGWMKHLGELDAEVTTFTNDGGIDVHSLHYIAQVKNYAGAVGVAEVREFAGVTSTDGRAPLFFTSGGFASGALEFAERSGIACFRYDAIEGTLSAANARADEYLATGL